MAMQPEDSVRKKRRTIQFGGSSAAAAGLRDCDDEGERQRLREDELGRRIHNASTPRRSSFGKPAGTSRYIAVGGVPGAALAQVKPLSAAELESLHRSCMELNQSNRITAQNSWNLKLIDYLQEVMNSSLSQNQNFQVASVTIECSVKIYSSRVDSLESESLRVVGSLHRSDAKPPEAAEAERREDAAPREPPARKAHHAATLEANVDNLDVRNVEAQFDVDPLFRITCSKFDAGGAAGLLLNNIRIGPYCQLMLDSSIVPASGEIDEEELWGGLNAKSTAPATGDAAAEGEDDDINDVELRGPSEELPPEVPFAVVVEETMVVDGAPLPDPGDVVPETQEALAEGAAPPEAPGPDDGDGSDGGDFNDGPDGSVDADMDVDGAATPPLTSTAPPALPSSDPPEEALRPAPDLEAIILEKNADEIADLVGEGNDFSYFNRELMAPVEAPKVADEDDLSDCDSELGNMAPTQQGSWTGMSGHWKFRAQRGPPGEDGQPKPAKEERKRKARESSRIDFAKPLTDKELKAFQPPNDPYSTLLAVGRERAKVIAGKITGEKARRILALISKGTDPKAMLNRAKRKCLYLPDDTHFDMDTLFQPFTRSAPEWNLKFRALRRKQPSSADAKASCPAASMPTAGPALAAGGPEFDGFAAPDPMTALPDLERDAEGLDAYSDGAGGGNDGDDGFDLDDSLNMTRAGQDLLPPPPDAAAARLSDASLAEAVPATQAAVDLGGAVELVQMPQHVAPIKVNYSKVAKQIDIKRLKDCMWNRIAEAFAEEQTTSRRRSISKLKFTDLIHRMEEDVRSLGNPHEITVSFYFISLLHLANEKGLELQGFPCLTDLCILSVPA